MMTRSMAENLDPNKLVSETQDEKISDPHPSKDPKLIKDFKSPSWLIFELEHSIKTLESMRLSTIIMFIKSINQKIGDTISLLQSNLLTTYFSDLEKKRVIKLTYRIWDICIKLTKQYPESYDSYINDFGFFAVKLDALIEPSKEVPTYIKNDEKIKENILSGGTHEKKNVNHTEKELDEIKFVALNSNNVIHKAVDDVSRSIILKASVLTPKEVPSASVMCIQAVVENNAEKVEQAIASAFSGITKDDELPQKNQLTTTTDLPSGTSVKNVEALGSTGPSSSVTEVSKNKFKDSDSVCSISVNVDGRNNSLNKPELEKFEVSKSTVDSRVCLCPTISDSSQNAKPPVLSKQEEKQQDTDLWTTKNISTVMVKLYQLHEFSIKNPGTPIVDSINAIERLHNRISMLADLQSHSSLLNFNSRQLNSELVNNDHIQSAFTGCIYSLHHPNEASQMEILKGKGSYNEKIIFIFDPGGDIFDAKYNLRVCSTQP